MRTSQLTSDHHPHPDANPAWTAAQVASPNPDTSTQPASPYLQLAKLRLNALVLVTTFVGYMLAAGDLLDTPRLLFALLGTALAAVGAGALNQYIEQDIDRLMHRTADRPLPARRLSATRALGFGGACLILGILLLVAFVNLLAAFLCVLTAASYLFLYTPLKSKGPVCTIVGAIPGAIPPMIGWAAARGELTAGAWVLFAILFMWQLPHFFAIAWMYREDYRRAGLPMISAIDDTGLRTAQHMVLCTLNLVFVSMLPTAVGLAAGPYSPTALILGLLFLVIAVRFLLHRSRERARQVLFGSLVYLPALLILLLACPA